MALHSIKKFQLSAILCTSLFLFTRSMRLQLQVTVILEIMMRKCGSALVKSLVPEKYRDFVKDVLEVIFAP